MPDNTVQMTVRLPAELARKLKSVAALNGKTIQQTMIGFAESYVGGFESTQARELAEAIEAAR
jgi:hypothetical protein